MNNAEKFKQIFGLYATEVWSMPESDFLAWLNRDVEIAQNVQNEDLIQRKAAIEMLNDIPLRGMKQEGKYLLALVSLPQVLNVLEQLPSAQPDNQTNLCDSCNCSFPDCPSKIDDLIFGNGIGNDNICACNKYKPSAQPEQKKDEWIPISKETNPTKSGWYLVTVHEDATNDNERFTGMAEFNAINGMWYDIDEPTDMYLRWMPLPAPYRGGEE